LGQIGRIDEFDEAEILEELINRYPIDSEKPDNTSPPSDV